jgi:hypothetical protein
VREGPLGACASCTRHQIMQRVCAAQTSAFSRRATLCIFPTSCARMFQINMLLKTSHSNYQLAPI